MTFLLWERRRGGRKRWVVVVVEADAALVQYGMRASVSHGVWVTSGRSRSVVVQSKFDEVGGGILSKSVWNVLLLIQGDLKEMLFFPFDEF